MVSPRAPARAHGLRRRQDLSARRHGRRRDPLRRALHLAGLHRLAARHPAPAPQGRDGPEGGRPSRRQPRRQGAPQRAGDVSARRAVPDRGRRAGSVERGHPRPRDAPARARLRPRRPLRPLRLRCSSTCRATATPPACASASARCWRRPTRAASSPSTPISRTVRWCGCSSSSPATKGRRRRSRPRSWSAASPTSCAPGTTGSSRRSTRWAPAAEALLAKYGAAFSAGYAETFCAERALQDIERIERLGPEMPVAIDFYREEGAPAGRCAPPSTASAGPSVCRSACRCWRTSASCRRRALL